MRIILAISFLIIGIMSTSCNSNEDIKKPNILIINVDDLGWKDLGYTGSQYYETPNIDQLSKSGMVFTNGYASAANCAPSRACLMTGKWTTRHGIYTVASSERGKSRHRKLIPTTNKIILSLEFPTIASVLHENSYMTCHSGKWHLSSSPLDYGFEVNIGGSQAGHPSCAFRSKDLDFAVSIPKNSVVARIESARAHDVTVVVDAAGLIAERGSRR